MNDPFLSPESLRAAARIVKSLAHPIRLCIVAGLTRGGPRTVSEMQGCLGAPQAIVSQHLARLRAAGVVMGERDGNQVRYRVHSELARVIAEEILAENKVADHAP